MNENQNSFFDGKTIAAVFMVGVIWVAWQMYMQKKYGQQVEAPATVETSEHAAPSKAPEVAAPTRAENTSAIGEAKAEAKIENYDSEQLQLQVSSAGLALQNVKLKTYTDRQGQMVELGDGAEPIFEIRDKTTQLPIPFRIKNEGDGKYSGVWSQSGMQVQAQLQLLPAKYSFTYSIHVENPNPQFQGLIVKMADHVHETTGGNFLMPSYEHNEAYVAHDGTTDRPKIQRSEVVDKTYPNASVVGLGSHYFAIAALDTSDVMPQAQVRSENSRMYGYLNYQPIKGATQFQVNVKGYMGPKSFDVLRSVDEKLVPVINFGALSWLAHPILLLMKFLYTIFHNYGWSIIVLTLIVRALVLPFNIMSYKSMKAMQVIQPQIKALRERFKDDPQQLNLQMMSLMKTNKVNPLGGCLPMLLQLPVFFALYQVLGQSIELYKAPFIFWIQDLSIKDPYYVLPLLMGISMFVQQKITPTTMDPAQAKVMMFMPVLFSLLMFGLPSGLTLYIFVSTLFGIFQQYVFLKDRNAQLVPVQR